MRFLAVHFRFNSDASVWAYAAATNDRWFVVINGKKGRNSRNRHNTLRFYLNDSRVMVRSDTRRQATTRFRWYIGPKYDGIVQGS